MAFGLLLCTSYTNTLCEFVDQLYLFGGGGGKRKEEECTASNSTPYPVGYTHTLVCGVHNTHTLTHTDLQKL